MDATGTALEDRVEALTRAVEALTRQVEILSGREAKAPVEDDATVTSRRNLLLASAGVAVAALAASRSDSAKADTRATIIADASDQYGLLASDGGDPTSQRPLLNGNAFGVIGTRADSGIPAPVPAGVFGSGGASSGVLALSNSGSGLYARSFTGVGAQIQSVNNYGLRAECTTAFGAIGAANTPLSAVLGISNKGYGVAGTTTAAGKCGVAGQSFGSNGIGVYGYSRAANSYAGYFIGNVLISGSFRVTGAKSAAIEHPDGTHRLVYCVEAPEAWLEDFGDGTLQDGAAEIDIDPDFAVLCDLEKYHVFLTAHGDYHLHVAQRSEQGFTVAAAASGRPAASGSFSYRVVAKRRNNPGERLEKIALPTIETEAA